MKTRMSRMLVLFIYICSMSSILLISPINVQTKTNDISNRLFTDEPNKLVKSFEYSDDGDFSKEEFKFAKKNIEKSLTNSPVKYTLPIVGYSLKILNNVPIEHDDFGKLNIDIKKNDEATVILKTKSGDFRFKNIPITGEFSIDETGTIQCEYELNRPRSGFFMKIVTDPEVVYIELACDTNESQLCYQNLIQNNECDFKPFNVKKPKINLYNQMENTNRFEKKSFKETRNELITDLKNGVKVHKNSNLKNQLDFLTIKSKISSITTITTTNYVLSFEGQGLGDDPDFHFSEDMCESNHYLTTDTEIDAGLYRYHPYESAVKSDLTYYNRDNVDEGTGYRRNIKAYAPYAHSTGSTQGWYLKKYYNWIWPIYDYLKYGEVEDLWYLNEDIYSGSVDTNLPTDMIILASICFGYADSPTSYPYMPAAFYWYEGHAWGALSYVGCTRLFESGDAHDDVFWSSLCEDDLSVYAATIAFINSVNPYIYPDYVYGTDIKIYGGTTNAYLGN